MPLLTTVWRFSPGMLSADLLFIVHRAQVWTEEQLVSWNHKHRLLPEAGRSEHTWRHHKREKNLLESFMKPLFKVKLNTWGWGVLRAPNLHRQCLSADPSTITTKNRVPEGFWVDP